MEKEIKNNNSVKNENNIENDNQNASTTNKPDNKPEAKEKISKFQLYANHRAERKNLRNLNKLNKIRNKKIEYIKNKYSSKVIGGKIVSITNLKPNIKENIIEIAKVKKSYLLGTNTYNVLKDIDLKIKRGELVVILGPSGSGKTTLLNVISGLDTVDNGDIFVDGYNIAILKDKHLTEFRRQKIGFVFQQYNLLPHLTAKENAEVGYNLNKKKNKSLTIEDIFKMIWMSEHIHKFPYQLSGGQQQRISIARALAKEPAILFCDEPTGALDESTGRVVLDVLVDINKKNHTTIILVTHNPNIAQIADSVIRIQNGQIIEHKYNITKKSPQDIPWS